MNDFRVYGSRERGDSTPESDLDIYIEVTSISNKKRKRISEIKWEDEFKLIRILEYASFPDLIAYPFENMKKYLPDLNIDRLRTSENRIGFLKVIRPFLVNSSNWDEVFDNLIKWRKFLVKRE